MISSGICCSDVQWLRGGIKLRKPIDIYIFTIQYTKKVVTSSLNFRCQQCLSENPRKLKRNYWRRRVTPKNVAGNVSLRQKLRRAFYGVRVWRTVEARDRALCFLFCLSLLLLSSSSSCLLVILLLRSSTSFLAFLTYFYYYIYLEELAILLIMVNHHHLHNEYYNLKL